MIKAVFLGALLLTFQQPADSPLEREVSNTCKMVNGSKIYSNAYFVEEAGDVVGIEIAVFPDAALLFDYQGSPFAVPIPLKGSRRGNRIKWSGKATEQLIEYPTKRKIAQEISAEIEGTLSGSLLKGRLRLNTEPFETVRLKHVSHLWICKANKAK